MRARKRLEELRAQIPETSPAQARAMMQNHALLLDVRSEEEILQGAVDGAVLLDRGHLELRIEGLAPDPETPIVTMCGGGVRSLFAADDLRRLGYTQVCSMAGGFNAWKDAGLPFYIPELPRASERVRYARQLMLPQVGPQGQKKLADARVLILGAGGLGSPAALYLAAAGVGTIGLLDHDRVERSNLNRQIIHRDSSVGQAKTESARQGILALNPDVQVQTHSYHLSAQDWQQGLDIFSGYDIVIDGTDNFDAHYLANDLCVQLGLPCVHGSVFRFDAQISVFWPGGPAGGPCYRCLYAEAPPPELAPSCNEAGVLGVVPGLVGMIQATEALKILLNMGDPLLGRLLCMDALEMRFHELKIYPDPDCGCCHAAGRDGLEAQDHERQTEQA